MREVDPKTTSRAQAFGLWMAAKIPIVTLFKTIDVLPLIRFCRKNKYKFNMAMCWCVCKAALDIPEFYLIVVGDKLMQYDKIAVNAIVTTKSGDISNCDIPFSPDLKVFNEEYLKITKQVYESGTAYDLSNEYAIIGTSALVGYDIDGAVNMYTGFLNNPFLVWANYKKGFLKAPLKLSFQFHHVQMDGAHAARFLDNLQKEIKKL